MDLHPSSKFASALAFIFRVTRTTLDTHAAASSTCSKKATAARNITVNKVIGSAAGIMKDQSILPRLSFSLQGLVKDDDGLDFFFYLYAELLSRFAGPYAIVSQMTKDYTCRDGNTSGQIRFSTSTDGQYWPHLWRNPYFNGPTQEPHCLASSGNWRLDRTVRVLTARWTFWFGWV